MNDEESTHFNNKQRKLQNKTINIRNKSELDGSIKQQPHFLSKHISIKRISNVFERIAKHNSSNELIQERNRVNYLENELHKQEALCDNQIAISTYSQTKQEYKSNLKLLYHKVS